MRDLFALPVREFLERAGAGTPTPGGGSVAALTGALAAAMLRMVANLTLGREKYRDVEPTVREVLESAGRLAGRFEELAGRDVAAFEQVMAAFSLPRATEAEKEERGRAVQDALAGATEVPLETARAALETLRQAERLAAVGNELVLSDAGVAGHLAGAAVRSALINVAINARLMKDRAYTAQVLREKEKLAAQAADIGGRVEQIVNKRLGIDAAGKEVPS